MFFWERARRAGFVIPKLSQDVLDKKFEGTNCRIIDGRYVSQLLLQQCKELVVGKKIPHLAVLLVGEDSASHVYVRNKETAFAKAGFKSTAMRLPAQDETTDSLIAKILKLNADKDVDGILVQLPLPKHIDAERVLNSIDPQKDVDGFLPMNVGLLACDRSQATYACTPFGVMILLASYGYNVSGKRAVVVGRSQIVGKPMALLLLGANATVTIAHSKTDSIQDVCLQADFIVAAVGKASLIQENYIKPGAVLIDVGMNRSETGQLCGDADVLVTKRASAMTPVPGGVGPMTIAMLCVNTALAAWKT